MHVLSKVLLGLLIVSALVAVMLTSKLRLARGAWLEKVATRQADLVKVEEELRKKELTVAAAREDVNRLMNLWGNEWTGVQGQVSNPQLGAVVVGVGANNGLGRRELAAGAQLPTMYGFAQDPQGQGTIYVGEFRATGIEAGQAAAQLTRPPYQGEAQSWPQGPWRVRESIPANWRAIFAGLQSRTAEALQDVQDQQARLATADSLIAKSQEQLGRRLGQLDGKPDAIEGSSEEVLNGLVMSLRTTVTERDVDLKRLDDLRHEYDRKYRALTNLIERNRELERALPQPGDAATTPADDQQAVETNAQPSAR